MILLTASLTAAQIVAIAVAGCALLLSAFVSGSEIAYFSLTPDDVDELREQPAPTARQRRVLRLISQPERLLATILISNNLVNVAIVVLLNFALGPVFSSMPAVASFVLQTVILTFLILLFGEILPKLSANTAPLKWAGAASAGLTILNSLFHPLASVMVSSSGFVKRVVKKQTAPLTADDLSQALELADGVASGEEKQMLEGILRFGDTTASEIMTARVDMTDLDWESTFAEVVDLAVRTGYARIPVYEDSEDNIRGILYARDLLPYIGPDAAPPADWHKLLKEPYFVPESRTIDDLFEDFRRRRIHMAVVIDEYGGTQGIVTLEDVLEEIVGDINDEYDDEEQTYKRLPDDTYVFEGRTLLTDFFRVTGLDEADYARVTDDCETVAGMLLAIKGDFPKEKEPLVYGRCRFLVLDVDHHRITSVRVKIMPQPQADANVPPAQ